MQLKIVILGLSITSSWGNGHATTYRALARKLDNRGHKVVFLERDMPWYAQNRDMPDCDYAHIALYSNQEELRETYRECIREADLVIVGSYVPDGVAAGGFVLETARGITAFYDIDTPVTLAKLREADYEYLSPDLIPRYDLYLSFTGGPVLKFLEDTMGSPMARPLYCSVDPFLYFPMEERCTYDLGYLGTYSRDRQPSLEKLMFDTAGHWPEGRFVVAGPQFPSGIDWPENVSHLPHIPPDRHCIFYNSQRFTLNITRRDMIRWGYSPSVRLFEAAACGVPVISDYWEGLDTFLKPGEEILVSRGPGDTLDYLKEIDPGMRRTIGRNARKRVLERHTAAYRVLELENYIWQARDRKNRKAEFQGEIKMPFG